MAAGSNPLSTIVAFVATLAQVKHGLETARQKSSLTPNRRPNLRHRQVRVDRGRVEQKEARLPSRVDLSLSIVSCQYETKG